MWREFWASRLGLKSVALKDLNLEKKITPAEAVAKRQPPPTEAMSTQLTKQIKDTSNLSPEGTIVFGRGGGT
jgi:hypothetical protein